MVRRDLLPSAALATLSVAVAASFGRVFASDRYLLPLVGAALAPHALGLLLRARRAAVTVVVAVSLAALAAYVVWALLLHTTTIGIPGGDTLDELSRRFDQGWSVLRHDTVPVAASSGAILLSVIAVWAMAQLSDLLAFSGEASLGALAPGLTVFIWLAALGSDDGRTLSGVAVGLAAALFLAVQHQTVLAARRTNVGRMGSLAAPRLLVVGAVIAICAISFGAIVAPALPGSGAAPLVDLRDIGTGKSPSYRTSVAPLVDVGAKLNRAETQDLFTVQSPRPDYWRLTALDEYRATGGGQWTLSAEGDDAIAQGLDEGAPNGAFTQEYRIGPLDERWMPAAYRPVRIDREDTLVVRASSTLVTGEPRVTGMHYTVVSAPPPSTVTAVQQAATARPVPASLRRYTELPSGFSQFVVNEAKRITQPYTTPYAQAKALRDYFRDGSFVYDTTVDPGDASDAIAAFLLRKSGFCVQFASAYATMARAVGIPARVAVGFTSGTLDEPGGVYRVTTENAHAWPEIWLAGLGWTHLFDPTPPVAAGRRGGSALPAEVAPPVGVQPTATATTPTATTPTTATTPGTGSSPPGTQASGGARPSVDIGAPAGDGGSNDGLVALVIALALIGAAVGAALVVLAAKRRRRAAAPGPPGTRRSDRRRVGGGARPPPRPRRPDDPRGDVARDRRGGTAGRRPGDGRAARAPRPGPQRGVLRRPRTRAHRRRRRVGPARRARSRPRGRDVALGADPAPARPADAAERPSAGSGGVALGGAQLLDERLTLRRELTDLGLDVGGHAVDRDEERELPLAQRVEDLTVVAAGPDARAVGHELQPGEILTRRDQLTHRAAGPGQRDPAVEQGPHHPQRHQVTERVGPVGGVGACDDDPVAFPVLQLCRRAARQAGGLRGREPHAALLLLVAALPAVAPPLARVAEEPLERARAHRVREALEARPAHLADVALDDEQARQHHEEAEDAEGEDVREGREEQHETGDEAEHGPLHHPRRVPVQRRVGDLLDELRVGDREVRLDLPQDPLFVL